MLIDLDSDIFFFVGWFSVNLWYLNKQGFQRDGSSGRERKMRVLFQPLLIHKLFNSFQASVLMYCG